MQKKFGLTLLSIAFGLYANAQVFNIIDYGAIAGGQTVNSEAIQKAIDAAAAKGGGKVVVPAGVFLTGTIRLKIGV
jgi:polygalacturonase